MPKIKIDKYDRKILELLQNDGRLSNLELAERIGLSPSPCLRRVRLLEEAGAIQGYGAKLDRDSIGLGLTVFVNVKVERHREEQAEAFCAAVAELPEVVSAHLVSGESDFLLQVVVPDLKDYEAFSHRHVAEAAGSQRHTQQLRHPDGQAAEPVAADSSGELKPRAAYLHSAVRRPDPWFLLGVSVDVDPEFRRSPANNCSCRGSPVCLSEIMFSNVQTKCKV